MATQQQQLFTDNRRVIDVGKAVHVIDTPRCQYVLTNYPKSTTFQYLLSAVCTHTPTPTPCFIFLLDRHCLFKSPFLQFNAVLSINYHLHTWQRFSTRSRCDSTRPRFSANGRLPMNSPVVWTSIIFTAKTHILSPRLFCNLSSFYYKSWSFLKPSFSLQATGYFLRVIGFIEVLTFTRSSLV